MPVFSPGGDYADVGVVGGGELVEESAAAVVDGEGGVGFAVADVDQQIALFGPVAEIGVEDWIADQRGSLRDRIANVLDGGRAAAVLADSGPGDVFAGDIDARVGEAAADIDAGGHGKIFLEEGDGHGAAVECHADVRLGRGRRGGGKKHGKQAGIGDGASLLEQVFACGGDADADSIVFEQMIAVAPADEVAVVFREGADEIGGGVDDGNSQGGAKGDLLAGR